MYAKKWVKMNCTVGELRQKILSLGYVLVEGETNHYVKHVEGQKDQFVTLKFEDEE